MKNTKRRKATDEDLVTQGSWIGATLVPGGGVARPVSDLKFHIFQASWDSKLFLIVTDPGEAAKAVTPRGGDWLPFKVVPELGRPRIGFSESEAKEDIADHGYHLVSVAIAAKTASAS